MKRFLFILIFALLACQKQMLPLAETTDKDVAVKPEYSVQADLVKPVKK